MENRNLGLAGAANLQVKLTHGAGGDQAVRPCDCGALNNLINQRGDDLRVGGRQERAAAAIHQGMRDGFCPQRCQDVLQLSFEVCFLLQARRPEQGAAVIRHEFQALQAPPGLSLQAVQAVPDEHLHEVDDFPLHINGAAPALFQLPPGQRVLLQAILGGAEVVEAAGAHNHQRPARRGQRKIPGRHPQAQVLAHGLG